MNYLEKCDLVDTNPAFLARHFQRNLFEINFINTIKHHWKGYILCNKNRISGAWLTTCSQFYIDSKSAKTFRKNHRNVY